MAGETSKDDLPSISVYPNRKKVQKGFMINRPDTEQLIKWIEARNIRGLARAISIVENDEPGAVDLLNFAFVNAGKPLTVGFTGTPGSGKSTLIDSLVKAYRKEGRSVGIIAVDPSSPFSGGSILGDRIRMNRHSADPGVFIRSLANRGSLGGLSEATKLVLYLYKAFGFDVIIVETVGVGQDEIDIAKYADVTAVILSPGQGDNIQMSKAGIMEIADLFIVNKSDKIEAETTKRELAASLNLLPEALRPPVISTIAVKNQGIDELSGMIDKVSDCSENERQEKYHRRISEEIRSSIVHRVIRDIEPFVEQMADKVLQGNLTPMEVVSKYSALFSDSLKTASEKPIKQTREPG